MLVGTFYFTSFLFVTVVLGSVAWWSGFSIFRLIAYLKAELLLVLGTSSSESALPSLIEKMERAGCPKALLVQRASEIPWEHFDGIATLGVNAGASAPELLVEQIIDAFRARFDVRLEKVVTREERIAFNVPRELRETGVWEVLPR